MSKDFVQLKMLGIKTVVHLTPQKFDSLEAAGFNCIHYEVKQFSKELAQLDLMDFVNQIKTLIAPENK